MTSPEFSSSGHGEAAETQPSVTDQLREACVDLRSAIRTQVAKSIAMHQTRYRQEKGIKIPSSIRPVPSPAEMREILRRSHVVAAGTGIDNERMVRHFHRVYEDDPDEPDSVIRLVVTHVTHKSGEDETEQPQYLITVVDHQLQVSEGVRSLDEEEYGLPLSIIQRARELYP